MHPFATQLFVWLDLGGDFFRRGEEGYRARTMMMMALLTSCGVEGEGALEWGINNAYIPGTYSMAARWHW